MLIVLILAGLASGRIPSVFVRRPHVTRKYLNGHTGGALVTHDEIRKAFRFNAAYHPLAGMYSILYTMGMTRIAPVSYVRAHLPEMVASLGKKRGSRIVIT